jgi:hypothetical protein
MQIQWRNISLHSIHIEVRIKGGFIPQYNKWIAYTREKGIEFMDKLKDQTDWEIVQVTDKIGE